MKYTYFIVFLMIQNGEKATANTVLALDGCIDSVEDNHVLKKVAPNSIQDSQNEAIKAIINSFKDKSDGQK